MSNRMKKAKAQEFIMDQLAKIGYGDEYSEYQELWGNPEEATKILKEQMDRVAKMFGFKEAWFA